MHPYRKHPPVRFAAAFMAAALLIVASLFPAIAQAQGAATGTVTGRVLNQGTGEYLRNAVVSVPGTDISTVAMAGGNFTLLNVPAGATKLEVKYEGLDTQQIPVVVTAGQTTVQDVVMTNADYQKNVIKLGEYVVATEREGNAKAVMEQKNSIEGKSVLATDTFGTISEGNVAEFLKYLPGVMIDYVEADARSVSLGGLDPKYTAVTLDGSPIASSGMAAASGVGANRAFEFEQISINSIEMVELSRTPQPENPGSALAGVVNLRSKSAFDRAGRLIGIRAGFAFNSMAGNPFEKHPGWDDESHYRAQPNWGIDYADVFFNKRLGVRAGYNYSYTFAEQKAETVFFAFDTDLTNNATEIPRITSFQFRDSPKPTIRYNGNLRLDYKISSDLWVSARAEYNRYHAKFFSRDLTLNFLTTANSPDPDGAGTGVAGPVVAGVEYSLNSQTATNASVNVQQGGGATNKYGSTANFGVDAHYVRGAFRADIGATYSRSMTWYKDRQFGFFWSIEPGTLTGLGLRLNRNGPADPGIYITQTSGPDFRNLANHPNGFGARTNDRQGEDQRLQLKADFQYARPVRGIPIIFKGGLHITEWINNSDRPINNYASAFRGADNVAASADEALAGFAENYRMNFDFGGNIDGMQNVDRWKAYKIYQANPNAWTAPSEAQIIGFKLGNSRDAQEQIDALYQQTVLKFGKLTVAPGVRYEKTRGKAAGPSDLGVRESDRRILGNPNPTRSVALGGLGMTQAEVDVVRQSAAYLSTRFGGGRVYARQDYDTWLRYLHTTYRFSENLVLKSSWTQAVSRPDMNRLIGGLVVTNDDPDNLTTPNRANAGNANLIPEQSNTAFVGLEYYTKGIGLITVSGYRRDFRNFLRGQIITVPAGGSWNGEPLPTSISPNEPWEINTVANVAKSHMSAFEIAFRRDLTFLPGPFSKIRIDANYTRLRYDDFELYRRPTNLANLSWRVPYRNFLLRWNTNWTPGVRFEDAATSNGWARGSVERLTHTMDFTWTFRRNTDFFINARNIFNQNAGEYRGRTDMRNRWVETGALWSTGVNMAF
jgi:iron complex outermembrane receptor protein